MQHLVAILRPPIPGEHLHKIKVGTSGDLHDAANFIAYSGIVSSQQSFAGFILIALPGDYCATLDGCRRIAVHAQSTIAIVGKYLNVL